MAKPTGGAVLRAVRGPALAGLTDRDLLERFAAGDESAFAALVGRHGGMVLGVCRRVLPTVQDAEDACQATFLVLSRKAAGGGWQPSVANWLYTTARRVAAKARRTADRRAKREAQVLPPEPVSPLDAMTGREAFAALDAELARLPVIYREPLVLCYLEGLTRDEAATRLGLPSATVKSQLDRGRKKLADALTRRGIALGAGLLAVAATSSAGASPPRLVNEILAAAGGSPSLSAAALARGVVMTDILTKAKLAVLAAVATVGLGWGYAAVPAADTPKAAEKMDKPPAKADGKADAPKPAAAERVVTGKVVGSDGKPVQADLLYAWVDGPTESLGKTNPDGTFRVVVPLRDPGAFLVARAEGHGLEFTMPALNTPADVTFRLPPDVPVRGRVVDAQGKPVAGARVAVASVGVYEGRMPDEAFRNWAAEKHVRGFRLPFGDRALAPLSADAKPDRAKGSPFVTATDADGRFAFAGLGAERVVELKVTAAGLADTAVGVFTRRGFDPKPYMTPPEPAMREFSFGYFALPLHGPEPAVVCEPEKLIRGRLTDPDGKPVAGVTVAFSRTSERNLNPAHNTAVTGPDGRYTIRGAKKHPKYMVEVDSDPAAGLLPVQAFADDTVGYEPVTIDLKPGRGVVVTGVVREKGTGKPVACQVQAAVLAENPHAGKYPTFDRSSGTATGMRHTAADGRYRVVTIPGPVLLTVAPAGGGDDATRYRPAKPDPKHPQYFHTEFGVLGYYGLNGLRGFVGGSWCQVIDAKPGDRELTVDVELEPATRTPVKVVDGDGKPVAGAFATGLTHRDFENAQKCDGDTLTVFNVDGERRVSVAHPGRRLVGTLTVKEGEKGAVVRLGTGGAVTGTAVGPDGKPLAGQSVVLQYVRRDVSEAAKALDGPAAGARFEARKTTAGPDGAFRFDAVFVGESFHLGFFKGNKPLTAGSGKPPAHTVSNPGQTLDLGTVKTKPAEGEE